MAWWSGPPAGPVAAASSARGTASPMWSMSIRMMASWVGLSESQWPLNRRTPNRSICGGGRSGTGSPGRSPMVAPWGMSDARLQRGVLLRRRFPVVQILPHGPGHPEQAGGRLVGHALAELRVVGGGAVLEDVEPLQLPVLLDPQAPRSPDGHH